MTDIILEFKPLAAAFTAPTKHDLEDFSSKRSLYRRNIFHNAFLWLSDVAAAQAEPEPEPDGYHRASKYAIWNLLDALPSNVEAARDVSVLIFSFLFFVRS